MPWNPLLPPQLLLPALRQLFPAAARRQISQGAFDKINHHHLDKAHFISSRKPTWWISFSLYINAASQAVNGKVCQRGFQSRVFTPLPVLLFLRMREE